MNKMQIRQGYDSAQDSVWDSAQDSVWDSARREFNIDELDGTREVDWSDTLARLVVALALLAMIIALLSLSLMAIPIG